MVAALHAWLDGGRLEGRRFWRQASAHRGFSIALVTLLGLGIAANLVVYSVVRALVLEPFPFPRAERLVAIGSAMPEVGRELGYFERLSGPETVDVAARSRTLEHFLAFDLNSVRVRGGEYPERLFAAFVWSDPLATLGVEPALGRGFSPGELEQGTPVAVLSHRLWQTRFAGDSAELLGDGAPVLDADGASYRVIGVLPPHASLYGADLFVPMTEAAATLPRERRQFNLLARLSDGAELEDANAELRDLARQVEAEHAGHAAYRGWRLEAMPWAELAGFGYRDAASLTLGAAAFVLLLVCVNAASLLLTRAASRRHESALRMALGAGRWRLVRHSLVDAGLYASAGGVLGALLARLGLDSAVAWLPASMQPFGLPPRIDGAALAATAGAGALSTLLVALAPAWQVASTEPRGHLAAASTRLSLGRGTRRLQRLFVAAQVALALVLLAAAASLLAGLLALRHQDPGFETEGRLSLRISLPSPLYSGDAVPRFFDQLTADLADLPGVRRVSVASQVAPSTVFGAELLVTGSADGGAGSRPRPFHTVVGDDYLAAMGLPLVRGRALGAGDTADSPCALVVNQLAEERHFGGDALGRRARLFGSRFDSGRCEVVGVVADARQRGPELEALPEVFSHHRQAGGRFNQLFLVVRTEGDPLSAVPAVRGAVKRLDPDQPVYAVTTGKQAVADLTAPRRVSSGLLAAFALAALILAALGVHAVVAYGVALRRGEMSLRLALGARPGELVRLVVGESMRTVAAGLVVGLAGALAARRLVSSLAGEAGGSFWPVAAATLALLVAAVLASLLPALRTGDAGPAAVLRRP